MRYNLVPVREIIDEIAMGPFGSNIKVDCFVDYGVPVLNGSNVDGFRLTEDSFRYVTPEKAYALNKAVASRGDIIITHRGTLGQVAYIPQNSLYEHYVVSQSQFRIKCNKAKALPEFVVYYFHTKEGQHNLLSNKSQVGVPALARPSSTFQNLYMPLPSITEQEKIVSILTCLDDKIELNNKINANLEVQAQTIFKSWFVDFEPFRDGEFVDSEFGPIPYGWQVVNFTSIVEVLGGGTPKTDNDQYWNGNIPFFTPKDATTLYTLETEKYITKDGLSNCNSKLYPLNSIFITARGTVGKLALAGRDMAMNQSCYALKAKEGYSQFFVYGLAKEVVDLLKHKASGAVFDAIVTRDFDRELVIEPPKPLSDRYTDVVAPLYTQILRNSQENRTLSSLRDTLLPKLMSGEIEVPII